MLVQKHKEHEATKSTLHEHKEALSEKEQEALKLKKILE
jgi:hypothetical protein